MKQKTFQTLKSVKSGLGFIFVRVGEQEGTPGPGSAPASRTIFPTALLWTKSVLGDAGLFFMSRLYVEIRYTSIGKFPMVGGNFTRG